MNRLDGFIDNLKRQKLSVTYERLEIAKTVIEFGEKCFSVDELYSAIKAKGMAMAQSTLYRNLGLLRNTGLIELLPKSINGKTFYKILPAQRIICKLSSTDYEYDKVIQDERLDRLVLDICKDHGMETDGVICRIETRTARP